MERERQIKRERDRQTDKEIEIDGERERQIKRERERELHACASRKCGRALSIPHLCNWHSLVHGQTLANRTKPGPSLQVEKGLRLCYLLMFLLSKTV
jgi:hypothetical protein